MLISKTISAIPLSARTFFTSQYNMTVRPQENVWDYPRPPALLPVQSRLRVIWKDMSGQETIIADSTKAYRVLETSHPPTYYIPPEDVKMDLLKHSSARSTMCEWKGMAQYHDLLSPSSKNDVLAKARVWSYPKPTPKFKSIKDYLSFYATSNTDPRSTGSWTCMVDDDVVQAQEGDFYGSWITPEITGGQRGFKGGPGTWGW